MNFNAHTIIDRQDKLWQTLHGWPKIELHRHLEGSTRLSTLVEVAREYDIPLPAYDVEHLRPYVQMTENDEPNFAVFLSKFSVLRHFYRSATIIRRITREAIQDAAADNIKYMELRFTPHALARQNECTYEEVIGYVCEASTLAQRDFGIQVRLIVSVNRHESVDIAHQVLDATLAVGNSDVVAMDIAGLETDHPARPFQPFFDRARENGLHVTVHAGEWDGAASVRDAVESARPTRIGHGVRAIEDSEVVRLVREHGITLEVCPTSNMQSGSVAHLEHHPLSDLHYLDVLTTINTDDPSVCDITLTDELTLAHTALGLPPDVIKQTILNAARSAFLPDAERMELVAWFERELARAVVPNTNR
ncbi:MAG: adenosine deaminase [Chloroflexi bacterium]|nr:adenosine deaminase [Chloroflexota bacterium]